MYESLMVWVFPFFWEVDYIICRSYYSVPALESKKICGFKLVRQEALGLYRVRPCANQSYSFSIWYIHTKCSFRFFTDSSIPSRYTCELRPIYECLLFVPISLGGHCVVWPKTAIRTRECYSVRLRVITVSNSQSRRRKPLISRAHVQISNRCYCAVSERVMPQDTEEN